MGLLYNPIRIGITYVRDDEILETGYTIGTTNEGDPYAMTLSSMEDLLDHVTAQTIQPLKDMAHTTVRFTCITCYPFGDLDYRPRRRIINEQGTWGTGSLYPANCCLNIGIRGFRGLKVVNAGMKLSIISSAAAPQGRLTTDFINNEFSDFAGAFQVPWVQSPSGNNYVPGCWSSNPALDFVDADATVAFPVLGSMKTRTGNVPQRRGKML